jgi:hypothetical protein
VDDEDGKVNKAFLPMMTASAPRILSLEKVSGLIRHWRLPMSDTSSGEHYCMYFNAITFSDS